MFGASLSGGKPLSSFGGGVVNTKSLSGDRPSRPFGAPDSDAAGDDDDDEEQGAVNSDTGERSQSPEKDLDDRRKTRLQKG